MSITPLPRAGVVTAISAESATVLAQEVSYTLPYFVGEDLSPGDDVVITWTVGGGLIGRAGTL